MPADDKEDLAELTYQIRRLADKQEATEKYIRESQRDQLVLLTQIAERVESHRTLQREDVLSALRMAFDEVRQGLGLRALGQSPFPQAVPPSDAPIEKKERPPSLAFEVLADGSSRATFPKLTWKNTILLLKWTIATAAAGTSVVLFVRAVYNAIMGHIE